MPRKKKKKKKLKKRPCLIVQRIRKRKDDLRRTVIKACTGIGEQENAYEAVKRFVADGETEFQPLLEELETFPEGQRDKILRSKMLSEVNTVYNV